MCSVCAGLNSLVAGEASLLHWACVLHNSDAITLLTQRGISIKLTDKTGWAVLSVALSLLLSI